MPLHIKRFIFWGLVMLFLLDSAAVYLSDSQGKVSSTLLTQSARDGKLLFQEHNCTACHQLYGLGGYMGPDLTNVISQPGKGESYAGSFIKYGTARMPDFHLTDTEVDALLAYLKSVDKTGNSPIRDFDIQYDGTIRTASKE